MSSSNDTSQPGPWPEPGPEFDLEPGLDGVLPGGGATTEGGQQDTKIQGSRGAAVMVAGLNLGVLLALPMLIVIGVYTLITVYAIVKAVSAGPDSADPATLLVGVIGVVTLFVVSLGIGGWAIGRAADPKKRRY